MSTQAPLTGRRILVLRGGSEGERWAEEIRSRGAEAIVVPLVETAPPRNAAPLRSAASDWNLGRYGWFAITSPRGAEAFADAGAEPRPGARVASVGPRTSEVLRARGFDVDLEPERDRTAAGLTAVLRERLEREHREHGAPARILLPLSEIAGDALEEGLRSAGHLPHRVVAYRTVPVDTPCADAILGSADSADAILVTSGSAARELARRRGSLRLDPRVQRPALIAIGAPTGAALADLGLPASAVAADPSPAGMLDALAGLLAERRSQTSDQPAHEQTPPEGTPS